MAKKRSPLSKAQAKLWNTLSRLTRLKDLRDDGFIACVTCGKLRTFKKMQAGHFIPSASGNSTRYTEMNIHPQCYRCNINLGSNGPEYYLYMLSVYGEAKVYELILLSRLVKVFTIDELNETTQIYLDKIKALLKDPKIAAAYEVAILEDEKLREAQRLLKIEQSEKKALKALQKAKDVFKSLQGDTE